MQILIAEQAPTVFSTHCGIQFLFIARRNKKHVEKTDKT